MSSVYFFWVHLDSHRLIDWQNIICLLFPLLSIFQNFLLNLKIEWSIFSMHDLRCKGILSFGEHLVDHWPRDNAELYICPLHNSCHKLTHTFSASLCFQIPDVQHERLDHPVSLCAGMRVSLSDMSSSVRSLQWSLSCAHFPFFRIKCIFIFHWPIHNSDSEVHLDLKLPKQLTVLQIWHETP